MKTRMEQLTEELRKNGIPIPPHNNNNNLKD